MYTRHTNTKYGLATPEASPVNRRYRLPNPPLGIAHSTSGIITQPRLPRRIASPPRGPRKPLKSQSEHRSDHPVDFIIDLIAQNLYQHAYLNLAIMARKGLCATHKFVILITHLATILKIIFCFGSRTAKMLVGVAKHSVFPTILEVSKDVIALIQFVLTLVWGEVAQLGLRILLAHPGPNQDHIAPRGVAATTLRCTETPRPIYSTCGCRSGRPPSPPPLRKSRHTSLRPSPRPRAPTQLFGGMPQSPLSPPRSSLGHRAEDLQRILTDCSEFQLEAAGRFVRDFQAQSQARAGWRL